MSALKRWSFFCNRAHEMAPDFGDDGIRPHRNPCGLYCLASEVSALEARVKAAKGLFESHCLNSGHRTTQSCPICIEWVESQPAREAEND